VGSAQPVAAALDEEDWPESVGTIAEMNDSDRLPDKEDAKKMATRLEECCRMSVGVKTQCSAPLATPVWS